MQQESCDILVIGSGFAGSLLATIAQGAGRRVILLERDAHPRFAIGESSTPLANLKLEKLADTYNLPWLAPFANYGTWKKTYPQIACGMKRGFSFFHHPPGKPFRPRFDHANELFVEANPDEQRADTHWFRADFDAFCVERAIESGLRYIDRCNVTSCERKNPWRVLGQCPDGDIQITANFIVDATGAASGSSPLAAATGNAAAQRTLRTKSRTLFGHFENVDPWTDILKGRGHQFEGHPFDADASALHHIIDSGWMWVLRFDNGITSAGFSLDPERYPIDPTLTPEDEWKRLMGSYPSLRRQFRRATPVGPLLRTSRLQRRLEIITGPDWAALPHAAGFVDPFLSAGIAHSLFGVERLAKIITSHWEAHDRDERLSEYGAAILRELRRIDRIVAACYQSFSQFNIMTSLSMLYFAAVIYTEERIRAGATSPENPDEFLLASDEAFSKIIGKLCNAVTREPPTSAASFAGRVQKMIAPYNTVGLCDPERENMYPFKSTV